MFASVAGTNDLGNEIQPLRLGKVSLAHIFRVFLQATSNGMSLTSLRVSWVPVMVSAGQNVLRISKVRVLVFRCILGSFQDTRAVRCPHAG